MHRWYDADAVGGYRVNRFYRHIAIVAAVIQRQGTGFESFELTLKVHPVLLVGLLQALLGFGQTEFISKITARRSFFRRQVLELFGAAFTKIGGLCIRGFLPEDAAQSLQA